MSQVDWEARYRAGDDPWDKGEPHPVLPFFVESHRGEISPDREVLVPGCGVGHDVGLLAKSVKKVTALDLAPEPLGRGQVRYPAENISWQVGDFFVWYEDHEARYDLIWEHTCFCAISPDRRDDYVKAAWNSLKPGGLLMGVFFLDLGMPFEDGPPFASPLTELHERFDPFFDLVENEAPVASYPSRADTVEAAMVWRRKD